MPSPKQPLAIGEAAGAEARLAPLVDKFDPNLAEMVKASRPELRGILTTASELVCDTCYIFVIGYCASERARLHRFDQAAAAYGKAKLPAIGIGRLIIESVSPTQRPRQRSQSAARPCARADPPRPPSPGRSAPVASCHQRPSGRTTLATSEHSCPDPHLPGASWRPASSSTYRIRPAPRASMGKLLVCRLAFTSLE